MSRAKMISRQRATSPSPPASGCHRRACVKSAALTGACFESCKVSSSHTAASSVRLRWSRKFQISRRPRNPSSGCSMKWRRQCSTVISRAEINEDSSRDFWARNACSSAFLRTPTARTSFGKAFLTDAGGAFRIFCAASCQTTVARPLASNRMVACTSPIPIAAVPERSSPCGSAAISSRSSALTPIFCAVRRSACSMSFRAEVYFTFARNRVSCDIDSGEPISPRLLTQAKPTFCETAPSRGTLRRQAIPKSAIAAAAVDSRIPAKHQTTPFWYAESSAGERAPDGRPGVGPRPSQACSRRVTSGLPKAAMSSLVRRCHFAAGAGCARERQCSSKVSQPVLAAGLAPAISSKTICDQGPRPGSSSLSPSTRISSAIRSRIFLSWG